MIPLENDWFDLMHLVSIWFCWWITIHSVHACDSLVCVEHWLSKLISWQGCLCVELLIMIRVFVCWVVDHDKGVCWVVVNSPLTDVKTRNRGCVEHLISLFYMWHATCWPTLRQGPWPECLTSLYLCTQHVACNLLTDIKDYDQSVWPHCTCAHKLLTDIKTGTMTRVSDDAVPVHATCGMQSADWQCTQTHLLRQA